MEKKKKKEKKALTIGIYQDILLPFRRKGWEGVYDCQKFYKRIRVVKEFIEEKINKLRLGSERGIHFKIEGFF